LDSSRSRGGGRGDGAVASCFWVEGDIFAGSSKLAKLRTVTGVPMGIGENSTSLREFRRMVTIGKADYVQPAMVKLGITAMAKVAAEVEQAGATCVPNAFYLGPAFLAVLHCVAAKDKDSPLERMLPTLARLRSTGPCR
jgi:L-alanine-DL-glutamate epimerase-like enolase superfamily enzyme